MKWSIIQHDLKPYYDFKSLQVLCEDFNKLINTLKGVQQSTNPYHTWLSVDDERRTSTTDRY